MFGKLILPALIVGLILVACSGAPTQATQPAATSNPTLPESMPASQEPQTQETLPATPPSIKLPVIGVGEPEASPTSEEVGSGQATLEPEPEGEQSGGGVMVPGEIQIDSAEVLLEKGDPAQVSLVVKGSLPTPCHQFAYDLGQPDENGVLDIHIYSLADPDQICTQVVQPFEETIELGAFPAGKYTILVNGDIIQELDIQP